MSTDYNYDEQVWRHIVIVEGGQANTAQGQFFPYFVLVIAGIVTLPTTYSAFKPSKALENTAPRIQSDFRPHDAELIDAQKKKQKRRQRKLKRMLFSAAGWALMAWMIYLMIITARTIPQIWDPYEILGVSRSADEKALKSHYRKLSLTQHPDKVRLDPGKNITKESVDENWVEITKAFKALTDEEIRKNFLLYGNPDGKQSTSIGIALPKLIIEEGSGKYVLAMYGLLLGILLPYTVGSWWYGTQKLTKDKVLVSSAGNLFREYDERITEGGVVGALSAGDEFKEMLQGPEAERGTATVEKRVLSEDGNAPSVKEMTLADRTKLGDLDEGVRRKALGLLWAHLARLDLSDTKLNEEKVESAPTAHSLVESFIAICLAFGNTNPLLAAYRTSQNLVQAILPTASPLLQLPHFTPEIVRAVQGDSRTHMSIQDFMSLPTEERKRRVTANGRLTAKQYQTAMSIASKLPALKVEKAFFRVTGEKYIIPNSLVQFVIKARFIPPGSRNVPAVKEADLEEHDLSPEEERQEANDAEKKRIQPPIAHAPYFARDHSPRWHIFLADSKQGKIAVPPFSFSTFDKEIFDEGSGAPTYNVQTLKMQFGAPPQPGNYTFTCHLVCDSYSGLDTKIDVVLSVDDASKAEEVESEDDISEPEEGKFTLKSKVREPEKLTASPDSIAGQLNALKGVEPPKPKKKKAVIDDSDESDTDGDVDTESETDTETDTEDES